MKGKRVCRMHGGRAGAPPGERNGQWCHGRYTKPELARRKARRNLLQQIRALLADMEFTP